MNFQNAWANKNLYMQGAWADSKTGRLGLTPTIKVTIPKRPYNVIVPKRATVIGEGAPYRKITGRGPYTSDSWQPMWLIRYK